MGNGGMPPVNTPVTTPSPTGAARAIGNKRPNADRSGLGSTILTAPVNLMQQEQSQKKTLLGQ